MKILMTSPFMFPSSFGGDSRAIFSIAQFLAKRKNHITILTSNAYDQKRNFKSYQFNGKNLKIHYFNAPIKWGNVIITPSLINYLRKNIKKYDIIHLNDHRTFQNIITSLFALQNKIPYILQPHGSLLAFGSKVQFKKITDILINNSIINKAKKILALTEIEAKLFTKFKNIRENKISIIPNGINLSEYKNLPQKNVFKQKYNIKSDYKLILFLGRINRVKGLELLVKSFKKIADKNNAVKLIIAGPDDGYKSTLVEIINSLKISNKVIFTGYLSGRNKLEAYRAADVNVLPSIYDIFPLTILEACACGIPVITTKNCSISPILNKFKAGIIINRNENDLINKIETILNEKEKHSELIKNAQQMIQSFFTWDKIVLNLEVLYKKIINQ